MMKKFIAFTLSEVLVTVGIIGVISALTVPNLIKNYQTKAQTIQLRKVVNDFSNAVDMQITEEGKTSFATTSVFSDDNGLDRFINSKFKIIKSCSESNSSDCFANEDYYAIEGEKHTTYSCGGTSYVLANSASICVTAKRKSNGTILNIMDNVKPYLKVQVDTNGASAPNLGGRDMFNFWIDKNGEILTTEPTSMYQLSHRNLWEQEACLYHLNPDGTSSYECPEPETCQTSPLGNGCFAMIRNNNWEMNY